MTSSGVDYIALLKEQTDIGIALSTGKDYTQLLEMIKPLLLFDKNGKPNEHWWQPV